MVWCGVVWCGVVWCGVVWCGVVWCGVVWCGVVWCGVVWCGVVWCGVVWCGVIAVRRCTIPVCKARPCELHMGLLRECTCSHEIQCNGVLDMFGCCEGFASVYFSERCWYLCEGVVVEFCSSCILQVYCLIRVLFAIPVETHFFFTQNSAACAELLA